MYLFTFEVVLSRHQVPVAGHRSLRGPPLLSCLSSRPHWQRSLRLSTNRRQLSQMILEVASTLSTFQHLKEHCYEKIVRAGRSPQSSALPESSNRQDQYQLRLST